MSLTGTAFLYTLIVLSVVAVALPLALWSRIRGPRALRATARLLMVLFAQGTAVALVFVLVNNQNNLYDNWADLLGTGDHVQQAANLGADGTGGIALKRLPRVKQRFTNAGGPGMKGVRVTQLKGRVSGVNAEVYAWLPPQYHEPAYRHHKFPVVELLSGYPGSAKAWFGSLHAVNQLAPLMRSGRVAPFILIAPRMNLLAGVDTGCANITGTVDADTWLSVDVPKMVTDNFRAQSGPAGWAVAGYSAGGHCATKLAVAHPDRYRAAVSMSGYNDPIGERNSLASETPALRRANNPYVLLRDDRVPPAIALYESGQPGDGYEAAMGLEQVAKAPTTVHVVYIPKSAGGHNMALWRPQVVPSFVWLTEEMGLLHGRAGATPHARSSAGSRPAELASGTASRAGAARRP
ncbi:alpha/beta hydrolase [Streptomyces griseorubiginosus]|uniref:alpha/beta hydrolase n=1 Tax=Streptomyces griseorubiginosus TaxID=67304 RepID=UPI002E81562D|nr:alpha/beta hydrolase-fold protein [Streptomyces griseorubiginosus]WUB44180.1 alpha/beta hydrolase-fold protein [Streptomyces griseorubiginosus]WUB52698.1 alpha/beta hydrolase-fold protein [Streptomyces griseorubiginosus]